MTAGHVVLTLWTDDVEIARRADGAGVDRIGIDLDRIGKRERQAGLGTWISRHTPADLAALAGVVSAPRLFARINPLHDGTAVEVEQVLDGGARALMLPMFRTAQEVSALCAIVAGRARIVGLLETVEALESVAEIARVDGLDELHIGINDLALALGLANRFEVYALDAVARAAQTALAAGVRFGIGGIARVDDLTLPIDPGLVYAQYARLGATAALLSRSFLADESDLAAEVARARERLAWWTQRPEQELDRAREGLRKAAARSGRF